LKPVLKDIKEVMISYVSFWNPNWNALATIDGADAGRVADVASLSNKCVCVYACSFLELE
jgi:hypothetical protein